MLKADVKADVIALLLWFKSIMVLDIIEPF